MAAYLSWLLLIGIVFGVWKYLKKHKPEGASNPIVRIPESARLTPETKGTMRRLASLSMIIAGAIVVVFSFFVPSAGQWVAAGVGLAVLALGAGVGKILPLRKTEGLPRREKQQNDVQPVYDVDMLGELITSGLDEEYHEAYERLRQTGEAYLPRNRFSPEDVAKAFMSRLHSEKKDASVAVEVESRYRWRMRWHCVPVRETHPVIRIPGFDPDTFGKNASE